mgnify:CR=1 FL=1
MRRGGGEMRYALVLLVLTATATATPCDDIASKVETMKKQLADLEVQLDDCRDRAAKRAAEDTLTLRPTGKRTKAGTVAVPVPPAPDGTPGLIAWSANLCAARGLRTRALYDIAKQKKYSKYGGVVDRRRLKDSQDWIQAADARIARSLTGLKRLKGRPVPCTDSTVAQVAACLEDSGIVDTVSEGCNEDPVKSLIESLPAQGDDVPE